MVPFASKSKESFFFLISADHILAHLNHSVQFGSTVATLMTIQTKWAYQRFDLDGLLWPGKFSIKSLCNIENFLK